VVIGATVLIVLPNRAGTTGPRRLWPHAHVEARVESECLRAAETKSSFAPANRTRVLPLLARELGAPHVFATYGPKDYEILLIDERQDEVEGLVQRLLAGGRASGLEARAGLAWYPRDGRTADALLAAANASLRARSGLSAPAAGPAAPQSATMQRVREMAARVASSPINVLILGECGVGKDVLAQLVHNLSPRAAKPFVALNCAGLAETLLDSELFGHEKGAFTGAVSAKIGLLESAAGGTVFLDEIGDMPSSMQARLLRVIENREVRPVAGLKARPINVRFIAATNKDLDEAVASGAFRRDLLFRLNGITLSIPPLRERTDEVKALAETFIAAACADAGRSPTLWIAPEALQILLAYRWPGNIRELKNMMERAVVLCDGPEILPEHLPLEKMEAITPTSYTSVSPTAATLAPMAELWSRLPSLSDPVKSADRQRIIDALTFCNGNQTRAAERIGMPRRTFVSKLDHYGIPRPQKGAPGGRTPSRPGSFEERDPYDA
jgi:DNA-binding NtrC family response regulator